MMMREEGDTMRWCSHPLGAGDSTATSLGGNEICFVKVGCLTVSWGMNLLFSLGRVVQ